MKKLFKKIRTFLRSKNPFVQKITVPFHAHYKVEVVKGKEKELAEIRRNNNKCPVSADGCICNDFINKNSTGLCKYGVYMKTEVLDNEYD